MLRINEKDLELVGFDGGGSPIFHYEGKPFTGVLVCYEKGGGIAYEQECKDGFEEGFYKSYYSNGQIEEEYVSHNNQTIKDTYRKWDENGNLIDSF